MKMRKVCYNVVIVAIAIITLNSFVSAFAVGVSGGLNLYPGQELDAFYSLMNTVGGSTDISVEGQIGEGSEIVSFSGGNKFDVPAGGVVSVPIKYHIPNDALIGKIYIVSVSFKTLSAGQGSGSVGFIQDAHNSLTVTVIEKPVEQNITSPAEENKLGANIWLGILVILVVAVVLWWIIRKKAKN